MSPARYAVARSGTLLAGNLEFERLIGRGGSAEVWRARRPGGAPLAVKVPRTDLSDAAAVDGALRNEYACLSGLRHAHIVRVETLLCLDRRPALVMEYCGAGDLVSLLGAAPRHWAGPARALAGALTCLHAAGWVHRDLKPRNVLLADGQRAVLADFSAAAPGGARAGLPGAAAPYRPPWAGTRADPAEDIYAFAVLLHELVTGQWPGVDLSQLGAAAARTPRLQPLAAEIRRVLGGSASLRGTLSTCSNVLESLLDENQAD